MGDWLTSKREIAALILRRVPFADCVKAVRKVAAMF